MTLKPRQGPGRVLRLAVLQSLIVAAPAVIAAAPELPSAGGLLVLDRKSVV